MQKIVQKVKENKKVTIALIAMFLFALVYNAMSPYTADDYSYMLSFSDGTRITNPIQIFGSLLNHYLRINGRILPHFFVQFFMIFPKWVFNIVNAGVYVGLIWLVLNVAGNRKFNILMYIAVPVAFWKFVPAYGTIFLWMTGSANYLWAYFFSLLYMKVYINLYRNPDKTYSSKGMAIFSVLSALFGAYSEMVSFPVVFICFIILCIMMYDEKSVKKYWSYVIPIVTAACGYLTMVLCPAEVTVKEGLSLSYIFKNMIDIFEDYYQCSQMLLVAWAVLMAIAVCFKVDRKTRVISGCFLAISLISMAMLSVASYVVARHYATTIFYLIVAVVVLMQALVEKGQIKCVSYCICAYLIASNVWNLWEGTYDIYDVNRKCAEREAYICEQVERGCEVLEVPIITPLTKYSCKYDLIDISEDYSEPWPNSEIARYYGLKEIYGVKKNP